jgi:cellulose synthase/poly-beta-1,6-N-acetylglucosamine synthase-like glycosyltransferase
MPGVHTLFDSVFLAYFVALNLAYTVLLVLGGSQISDWVRRRPLRDFRGVSASPLSLPVTIIVPAYDEEPVIAASIRSLLASRYRELQVMVVNDGSTDGTMEALVEAFSLVAVERVPRANLPSAPVRGVYATPLDPRLLVVDKENGGKADALNCGIRYAAYPLICTIDADTVLDPDALARLVWAFQAEPETVATGGIVRIVNGSHFEEGRLRTVRTPRSLLVNVQIMEYLRAFLAGRAGWSRLNTLLIISGAFGLFRRETVVDAGGYDTTTVGEDAELIVRLHRHCRDLGRPYKITFVADPICWTEAPSDAAALRRQRDRWQRGLLQTLWRHRGMVLNPRYGTIGLLGLPFFVVFEAFGPLLELAGILYCVAGLVVGWVAPAVSAAIFGLAFTYGLVLSFGALLIEGRAFARYPSWRDLARLMVAAMVENFGYRQWLAVVRARATLNAVRPGRGWGEMRRAGFGEPAEAWGSGAPDRAPLHGVGSAVLRGELPEEAVSFVVGSRCEQQGLRGADDAVAEHQRPQAVDHDALPV